MPLTTPPHRLPLCIATAASGRRQATFALAADGDPALQLCYELIQRGRDDRAGGASVRESQWSVVEVDHLEEGELTAQERQSMDRHGWVLLHEMRINSPHQTDASRMLQGMLAYALGT